MNKHITTDVLNKISELEAKIDELESANDNISQQTAILSELLKIMIEIPNGKQIYNRAINRCKLNYLKNSVLPRREQQLLEFEREQMPNPLRKFFVKKEVKLLRSVARAIKHREYFEHRAKGKINTLLNNIFSMTLRHSTRLKAITNQS